MNRSSHRYRKKLQHSCALDVVRSIRVEKPPAGGRLFSWVLDYLECEVIGKGPAKPGGVRERTRDFAFEQVVAGWHERGPLTQIFSAWFAGGHWHQECSQNAHRFGDIPAFTVTLQ